MFKNNLAAPNKLSLRVNSMSKSFDHRSNSQTINNFPTFLCVKVMISCNKRRNFLFENPLDFHSVIVPVRTASILKVF